ncbi:MAG: dynamin family protein [Campylobacterales bacterium]|nr:dynamin family protein [Campylobacterales bacterium]
MNIADAFFQISHSKDLSDENQEQIQKIQNSIDLDSQSFLELFPIFISLNSKNIETFNSLDLSNEYIKMMFQQDLFKKEDLNFYKTALLSKFSQEENRDLDFIINSLESLQKEKFISKADFVSSKILIDSLREKEEVETLEITEDSDDKEKFNHKLNKLFVAIDKIKEKSNDKNFQKRLEDLKKSSVNSSFSIGVTGVMNAGKSTMLNGILGREILGTSVVPETANLTAIKHSKTERARVSFWSKEEWEKIKDESRNSDSLKEFVDSSEEFFGEGLKEYVTSEGKSVDIPINSLASYTSAKHSDLKCNLVRSVELFTDLEYVKNGVEIVDTPGIDDPVIQREEITKEYLRECDVLVHLMNANQSATAKDIDFILDALIYQNISRLLVVITRVDTVSQNELAEVIDYTKKSITNQLEKIEKSSLTNTILEKLEFIPLAGKMALLHRTGKAEEALGKGYNLEKSGILKVEEYLSKILFGDDNPKTKLIISSTLSKVTKATEKQIKESKEKLESLEKGEENLKEELRSFEKQKSQTQGSLSSFRSITSTILEETIDYVDSQDSFITNELNYFYTKFLKRVVDNINYKAENKERLDSDTIKFLVEFGIKDNLIDIARDYRYTIKKRVDSAWENAKDENDSFNKKMETNISFESTIEDLFQDSFIPRFLTKNNSPLIDKIESVVLKIGKRDIEKTKELVEPHLKATFDSLKVSLYQARGNFKETFFEKLTNDYTNPFEEFNKEIKEKEESMRATIEKLRDGSSDIETMKEDLAKEIGNLTHSLASLESVDELI